MHEVSAPYPECASETQSEREYPEPRDRLQHAPISPESITRTGMDEELFITSMKLSVVYNDCHCLRRGRYTSDRCRTWLKTSPCWLLHRRTL